MWEAWGSDRIETLNLVFMRRVKDQLETSLSSYHENNPLWSMHPKVRPNRSWDTLLRCFVVFVVVVVVVLVVLVSLV